MHTEHKFKPFWNGYTGALAQQLWCAMKVAWKDLASSAWNGAYRKPASDTWFNVKVSEELKTEADKSPPPPLNLPSIPSSFSLCSLPGIQACVQNKREAQDKTDSHVNQLLMQKFGKTKEGKATLAELQHVRQQSIALIAAYSDGRFSEELLAKTVPFKIQLPKRSTEELLSKFHEPAGRTKKILLYPTKEQRKKLQQCFGAVRWTYNKFVERYLADTHAGKDKKRKQKTKRKKKRRKSQSNNRRKKKKIECAEEKKQESKTQQPSVDSTPISEWTLAQFYKYALNGAPDSKSERCEMLSAFDKAHPHLDPDRNGYSKFPTTFDTVQLLNSLQL